MILRFCDLEPGALSPGIPPGIRKLTARWRIPVLMLTRTTPNTDADRFLTAQGDYCADDPLLEKTFGPWPHCQALVWEMLTDFACWTHWMPEVRAVHRLDSGKPGRGTRLQIDKAFHSEIWEILHWDCHERLDFEIVNPHCRAGFSIRLTPGLDDEHTLMRLDGEFLNGGSSRWLAYFAERKLRNSSTECLTAFADFFLAQKPLAD